VGAWCFRQRGLGQWCSYTSLVSPLALGLYYSNLEMPISDPGVDFFVNFHDLNPNTQQQCIYFVKQNRSDRRCKWKCSDNKRATDLYRIITERESGKTLVDDIREYIRCSCCARARHRELIESSPLIIPLVERWLDEILIQKRLEETSRPSAQYPTHTTPKWTTSRADSAAPSSCYNTASMCLFDNHTKHYTIRVKAFRSTKAIQSSSSRCRRFSRTIVEAKQTFLVGRIPCSHKRTHFRRYCRMEIL
jgi:hypothetical protein